MIPREKYLIRQKLNYNVRNGYIKKSPCQICGFLKVEAHHEDYNKPLEVIWLCLKHHREEHWKHIPFNEFSCQFCGSKVIRRSLWGKKKFTCKKCLVNREAFKHKYI